VLAVNVRTRFDAAVPEYGLAEGELWTHSVAASLAAEHLVLAAAGRLPSATTTAALLHDVGKLVMARFLDADVLLRVAQARDSGMTLPAAEAHVLGVDHGELGALVAQSWGLPLALVHGIGRHHEPDGDHGAIAAAVAVADGVARSVCGRDRVVEPAGDAAAPESRRARAILGLDPAALGAVHRVVEDRLDEVVARFAEPSPPR
jgi:putative nucleotidyltransferase with HDIG domain